jgi:signal transduction histidine kinase
VSPGAPQDRLDDATVAAAQTQARINVVVTLGVVCGLGALSSFGLVPAAIWPALVIGVGYVFLNVWFAYRARRRKSLKMGGMVLWGYAMVNITLGIHLLGEVGARVGPLLYFLTLIPGHDRRASGFGPFHIANAAVVAYATMRAAEVTGLAAPISYWHHPPDSAGLHLASVLCVALFLNCAALLCRQIERVLMARATALAGLNTTLTERNAQLQRLQHEFECYASGVAHDLANPLAAAMEGFAALGALLPQVDEEGQALVELTQRNMARALEMLGGLREITKTVAAEEAWVEVRMEELLASVIAEFDLRLRTDGIRLVVPRALPIVRVQRAKMVQVWRNLIGNAVKYVAGASSPEVRVGYERGPGGHEFSVTDNGVGIPIAYRERIFEPFERVPAEQTVASAGMGLGLTLVKRVVEQHGGQIDVQSEVGRGTTFHFTLPRREPLFQAA